MIFRIATLNVEQNHKCWEARRELIVQQLGELRPDMLALNEIHIPEQTGRWLQRAAAERLQMKYTLLQQAKVGDDSRTQAEGLLTRYPVIETANLDYRSHNCVALAARFEIDGRFLDVYVTHLIAARVEDAARQYQVGQLREWIRTRDDADFAVVCGDFNASSGPAIDPPHVRRVPPDSNPTDRLHAAAGTRRQPQPSRVGAV